ncbi:MAG: Pyrophosphatase PpaX [Firmicutes bacterium ADurb.Bin419]|nr:MAG: Pyrophosphatase PpaX [Firmicutes bacterium ADurb.Bin419]
MSTSILFDFDGTLVQSEDLLLTFFNELNKDGEYKKITKEDLEVLRNQPIKGKCKMLGIPIYRIPALYLKAKEMGRTHMNSVALKDGIKELLYELKNRGFKLNILSSNDEEGIREFVKLKGIDLFDGIYSSNNLFGKHHTIRRYMDNNDLSADDIWYVGDEVRDIVSCKKAKVKVIAVAWGYESEQLLAEENPDFLARKPCEILDIVLNY